MLSEQTAPRGQAAPQIGKDTIPSTTRLRSPSPLVPTGRGTNLQLPRHPNVPDQTDPSAVKKWLTSLTGPRAVDLFSGAGGLSLGLKQAGFTIIGAADSDRVALETHAANIPSLTWCGDLTDPTSFIEQLDLWGIDRVEVVAGGPPCQPFSRAGAAKINHLVRAGGRPANDERTTLWRSFFAVIDRLTPDAVLFENVPDFARVQDGELLVTFMEQLSKRGYHTEARVLEAWGFRVPQHRKRLIVMAVKDRDFLTWPKPLKRKPTLWQAIGDLPGIGPGQREEQIPYTAKPRTTLARLLRRGLKREDRHIINDHITRAVRPDDAIIFAGMKPGQSYKDVPDTLRRYRSDIFDDKYYRLNKEGLSRSITAHLAKDGYWYIHPDENRTLSIREAARVQTFPDRFRFAGHPSIRFRQIGNAVPPLLAEAIGRSLIENLSKPSADVPANPIRQRLLEWHTKYGRKFPWRMVTSPWLVLLAEVCLHRTRADQVSKIYPALASLAPTPRALIDNFPKADSLLSSLGLRWRVEGLINMARQLSAQHGGQVPEDREALLELPGVGDYVASAVRCFAFKRRAVLLDTNTTRIAQRMAGKAHMGLWEIRLQLAQMAYPDGPDSSWNYALLDLGALVCTARTPRCSECPLASNCAYRKSKAVAT